jgi:hypothetical protein
MANQQAQKDTPESRVERISSMASEAGANGRQAVKETVSRTAEAASRATQDATRTARDLSGAFTNSYGVFADGIQELQHGYWRIVQKSVDIAANAPAEMMKCRSLTELSELQRDIFHRYLDGVVDANRTLMDVSVRVAENAVRPLQEQIGRA